ncbi:5-(carboxyamino)imidazole ribonucleotide mutase, partial [bacterium]
VAIGNGRNAGLLAVRILSASDEALADRLDAYADSMRELVAGMDADVQSA